MAIITLITDFGLKDGNAAVMKGVILQIAPAVQIVDVSHLIQPQNILEAAMILFRSAMYFPVNTVHTIVVDPGVGTNRRPIAARIGTQYFVCPDNGILSLVIDSAKTEGVAMEFYKLEIPRFWLPQISHVFHGRDIFAPVAAHIANGQNILSMGSAIQDVIRFSFPDPKRTENGWQGEVIYIDHFGNIILNINEQHIGENEIIATKLNGYEIFGQEKTFGNQDEGKLIVLYGSTKNLIIAKVNGDAAKVIQCTIGSLVEITVR
jgi:S-adenosylmethionine hydrolase